MTISDWIASLALIAAIISAAIALYALREAKRSNQVALLSRREIIYDAFKVLVTEALCQGASLKPETVQEFEVHADSASKYLPREIAEEVSTFYEDCETIAWVRTLTAPVDETYLARASRAGASVHANALRIQNRLLALIRRATAA
jgi:hypothetical protein